MNTKIIDTATVKLSNGFQSGQWVRFIDIGDGKWELDREVRTGECTYTKDEKIRDLEVPLEGRGIVGGFSGVTTLSREAYVTGFFGFTAEELHAPTPEKGYTVEPSQCWVRVETLEDYLIAIFVWRNFTPWSMAKNGVVEMPYNAGAQAARSFALIIDGQLIDEVSGFGDCTPHLTESPEKCLADRKIYTTCEMLENAYDQQRANKRLYAAADAGDSEKWSKVRDHLRSSYEQGLNPLGNLRKKYPGMWTYYETWNPDGSEIEEGDVIFLENDNLSQEGWTVIYKPFKR